MLDAVLAPRGYRQCTNSTNSMDSWVAKERCNNIQTTKVFINNHNKYMIKTLKVHRKNANLQCKHKAIKNEIWRSSFRSLLL